MAEITKARTGALLRALFSILKDAPEGMPGREALKRLAERVPPTPYEAGNYESGRRYEKIVRFATVDCAKAGWLVKQKGLWFVTEAGLKALAEYPDPEAFYGKATQLYRIWKQSQTPIDAESDVEDETEKSPAITFEEAEETAWNEIQSYLLAMPPYDFQELVGALLRAMGYHVAWISPPGKDAGIDIIAYSDPLGTRPPRIKAQVKRYGSAIPVGELRSFLAVLGADDAGIFVTTSTFTKDAQEEARNQSTRRVTLIDLERLLELWIENYARLDDTARQRLPLRPIYFLAPQG